MNQNIPYKIFNNGITMPMVGLGVYDIPNRDTQRVVEEAFEEGYRSIDTGHNVTGWPSDALAYDPKDI